MKKLHKQLASLSLAMVMFFSFSSAVFAAEPKEGNQLISDTTKVTSDFTAETANTDGYGNVTGTISGASTSSVQSYPFTVPSDGAYMYFSYASSTGINILIRKSNGITITGKQFDANPTAGLTEINYRYLNQYLWPAGDYVLEVDFDEPNKAYSFALFALPSELE